MDKSPLRTTIVATGDGVFVSAIEGAAVQTASTHAWGKTIAGMVTIVLMILVLGIPAEGTTIAKTGGNPSQTGTTDYYYQGFKNHATLGAISENKYRMKVTGTGGAFAGVRGVYSEHDHYRRTNKCGLTNIQVGSTFGIGWTCNHTLWERFKKDDRSVLYTGSSYSSYYYSRAQLGGTFQPLSVGVATRTCLDLTNSPNVCSSHSQASKDL